MIGGKRKEWRWFLERSSLGLIAGHMNLLCRYSGPVPGNLPKAYNANGRLQERVVTEPQRERGCFNDCLWWPSTRQSQLVHQSVGVEAGQELTRKRQNVDILKILQRHCKVPIRGLPSRYRERGSSLGVVDVGYPRSPLDSKFMGRMVKEYSDHCGRVGRRNRWYQTQASSSISLTYSGSQIVWGRPEVLRGIKPTLLSLVLVSNITIQLHFAVLGILSPLPSELPHSESV